jgi:hypothetical protein
VGSSPGEDDYYSLETKQNRRTMPMPEFFEAVRNYRNKGDNPKNLSWFRVTVNTVSVAWELSMMKRIEQKLFVSVERLQEQRLQTKETILGSSPAEGVFCTLKINDWKEHR